MSPLYESNAEQPENHRSRASLETLVSLEKRMDPLGDDESAIFT